MTAWCDWCEGEVSLHYWANRNDAGDRGHLRDCGHGDYVAVSR